MCGIPIGIPAAAFMKPTHHRCTFLLCVGRSRTGDAEVSVCAANALAAAESNRAVLPLIHRVHNSSDIEQRAAAIRALGLVRDRRALTPLYSLIEDSSSEATTVAASLIALSRLGDPNPLDRFFERTGDSTRRSEVALLRAHVAHGDGVSWRSRRDDD